MADARPSLSDDARRIAAEVRAGWTAQPDKLLFGVLLVAWIALFHFLGNAVFGYIDTPSLFSWCYQIYQAPDEEHCLYVPLVVLGLLIWKRAELIALPKRNWWPAALIVLLGVLLHLGGYLVQQTRLSLVGFLVGLYGLTGWVWGPAWLRATVFPMFLLGFCIPISAYADVITSPLRILVTKVSVGIGHELLGIGVYRQGSIIMNAQGVAMYDVAPACSGIRSLISLFALGTVLAFVSYQAWWRRLILVSAALPLAVLGNILRITTVIIVGEAFGQPAGVMIEQKFGFLTFGFAMVGLFVVGHWLREKPAPSEPARPAVTAAAPQAGPLLRPGQWAMLLVGVVVMGGTATVLARLQENRAMGEPGLRLVAGNVLDDSGRVINTNTVALPETPLDYESAVAPITAGEADFLPKDTTYARRIYKAPDGFQIQASIVLMGTDRTSIHQPEICLPAQGWAVARQETVRVPMTQPQRYELPVMKMVGRKRVTGRDGQPYDLSAVYAYWFVADGKLTASHRERQWWSIVETARSGTLQRWAYVSLFAMAPPGMEEKAFERMTQFIQDTVPKFQIAPAGSSAGR